MSNRQNHPICSATYFTPDRAPYAEVNVEFYEECMPEPGLIKFLKDLPEVRKVTSSRGASICSPSVVAELLKIELKSGSQTSDACQKVKDQAGEWVYNRGCTHGTPQPKL